MTDPTPKPHWFHPTPALADRGPACGRGAAFPVGAVSVADVAQGLCGFDCRGCGRRSLRGHASMAHRRPCFPSAISVQHQVATHLGRGRGSSLQLGQFKRVGSLCDQATIHVQQRLPTPLNL